MKKNDVQIGKTYQAKVTNRLVSVRIDSANRSGGWNATNLATGKKIRIKTAGRLRGAAAPKRTGHAPRSQMTLAETKKLEAARAKKTTVKKTNGKLSVLDAAAKVLATAKKPLNTKQLIEVMASKGLWKSPGGKTPDRTLYAAMAREIATRGKDAQFKKVERGLFAAKA